MRKKEKTNQEKQEDFCHYFVRCMNPEMAAIQAGYSKSSARKTASRLLKDEDIKEKIRELKGDIDTITFLEASDIVNKHVAIINLSISDYLDIGVKKDRFGKEKTYIKPKRNFNELPQEFIQEMSSGKDGFKLKLIDKKESYKFLEKWFDLDKDYKLKELIANRNYELEKQKLNIEQDEDKTSEEVITEFFKAVTPKCIDQVDNEEIEYEEE